MYKTNVLSFYIALMCLETLMRVSTACMIPTFMYVCLSFPHSLMVPVRSIPEATQSVAKGNGRCALHYEEYFLKWNRAQAYPKPLPVLAISGNFL